MWSKTEIVLVTGELTVKAGQVTGEQDWVGDRLGVQQGIRQKTHWKVLCESKEQD